MNFLVIVFLATIGMANCEFNEENFVAQLNLIDMDLEDECDDISESTRNYILKGSSYLKERVSFIIYTLIVRNNHTLLLEQNYITATS